MAANVVVLLLSVESVVVLCFVVLYFMSILVYCNHLDGEESWLFCLFVFLVSRGG